MSPFLFRRKLCGSWWRCTRSTFKRKRKPKVQVHRLPQEIVEMVMSFLPMKDAARTSLLSSEWRQGWATYPKLTLNSETMLGVRRGKVYHAPKVEAQKYREKFIENVNAIMRQRQGLGVEEFVLEFGLNEKDAQHIDSWVTHAASIRLERFVIDLSVPLGECKVVPGKYAFSLQLLDEIGKVKPLRILQLINLSLKPLGDFRGFLHLTMLELQRVCVAEDDLESLLCRFPALERLALNFCGPFVSLRIGHQLCRLVHLSLGDGIVVDNLRIDAINLKTISHSYNIRRIVVRKDSQITEVIADMNTMPLFPRYKDTLQYMFTGLPSALPCLEKLSLNIQENIQTMEVPKCTSRFMHLRHLTLSMHLSPYCKFDILRLVHVLEAAPVLEHFELNVDELMMPYCNSDESLPSVPRQAHDHLKTASFTGFILNKDLIALALHVLRNAESLELMRVRTRYESDRWIADHFLRGEDPRNVVKISTVRSNNHW
ncbi:unnamed protein product [Alopecurus aequalis]